MKPFAFILIFSMLSASIIPCHAGEHEHRGECSHHEHHDHDTDNNSSDEENEDHPCSPFCGYHASVNSPTSKPSIISVRFSSTKNVEQVFNYTPTYFYLQEFSIWNPPKI